MAKIDVITYRNDLEELRNEIEKEAREGALEIDDVMVILAHISRFYDDIDFLVEELKEDEDR